jgi:uncharacterized protein YjbI with pentapeptide repeats
VFRARGRDLRGAIFDFTSLPKADFSDAELQSASFVIAKLPHAFFDRAQLQGALLKQAVLATLDCRVAALLAMTRPPRPAVPRSATNRV